MADKKFIPYSTQRIDKNDINAVVKVLKSGWLTQGPQIKKFEHRLSSYCGAKYAVVVSSGTAALHLSCLALGIEAGDEVITSPITFAASANCILYCGGKPVFADVQEDTANIDSSEIKKKITKKTKAILPVHFSGHPCDLDQIQLISREKGLAVIEDAAHALGAEYRGSRIGACKYSDLTILSFHPVKTITAGEGGAVLTNNKDLYDRLLLFRNHGITRDNTKWTNRDSLKRCFGYPAWYYEMQVLGFNYRITDIQAALGSSQLKKIDNFIMKRRKIAGMYNIAFKDNPYFDIPAEREYVGSAWHLYSIRLKDNYARNKINIVSRLRKKGLGIQVHYIPVYSHPYYKKIGFKPGLCPTAESFYEREISIPLYPAMQKKHVRYVISTILEILKNSKEK